MGTLKRTSDRECRVIPPSRAADPVAGMMSAAGAVPLAPTKAPVTKADVLNLALEAVADRGLNYGSPEDNFSRIARLWNTHLVNAGLLPVEVLGDADKGVTAADVAAMMVLMKVARLENQPRHLDSWIDIAGYAACGAVAAGVLR